MSRRLAGSVALGCPCALLLAACFGGSEPEPTPSVVDLPVEQVVLKFQPHTTDYSTYDRLLDEYEALHPGIVIETVGETHYEGRQDPLWAFLPEEHEADIVEFTADTLGSVMADSDQFVDLRDYGAGEREGDFLPWKWEQAVDRSGRVIGYGTDIGPEGLCFRQDLLAEAGIARDRDELAELLSADGGGWDVYFEVGRRYHEVTGRAWFDQSEFVWRAMGSQLPAAYYTAEGVLNVEGNAELKARWDLLAAAVADGLSAAESPWNWGWTGGEPFVDGTFATFVCPGWMLEVVQDETESDGGGPGTGWDFADVFPGGAANWAGGFLGVPATSEHQEAAADFASWLTSPEQQLRLYEEAGAYPSTLAAIDQLAANARPDEFFNDAPVNAILASRAQDVVVQFTGPGSYEVQDSFCGVAGVQDQGTLVGDEAWNQVLTLVSSFR